MTSFAINLAFAFAATAALADDQPSQPDLTVMHWSTNHEAINVLLDAARTRGIDITEISFGSHRELREAVSDLIRVGHPPQFSQWIASGDLDALLSTNNMILTWPELQDRVLPKLRDMLSVRGEMSAIPFVTHIQNSMFVNRSVLERHGLALPADWRAFVDVLRTLDAAGVQGVITSSEPWQLRMLFDDILLGLAGVQSYHAFYEMDLSDDLHQIITETFQLMFEIRSYQKPDQPEFWGDVAKRFAQGDIGFFFLGDFAWIAIERTAGDRISDFECLVAPGAPNVIVYATDIFIGFRSHDEQTLRQQLAFGDLLLDPEVHRKYLKLKGGMPVIPGIKGEALAPCARYGQQLWSKESTELISTPWSYNRTALSHLETLLEEIWSDRAVTAEQAADLLMNRLEGAHRRDH